MSRFSALASVLRRLDALHAERALLHHADFAHRDVRVELQVQRLVPGRVEEVEEAHVVRAGVGAVAGADAAVVDLRVQAVFGVVAGVGRTDRLARGGVALLAQHRPELHLHVGKLALPVAFDADPVHGAAARRLLGADGRNVVLGVAGRDARLAARAASRSTAMPQRCAIQRFSRGDRAASRGSPPAKHNHPAVGVADPRRPSRGSPPRRARPVSGSSTGARIANRICAAPAGVAREGLVPLADRHRDRCPARCPA